MTLRLADGFDWINTSATGANLRSAMLTKWKRKHSAQSASIVTGRAGVGTAYQWDNAVANNFQCTAIRDSSNSAEAIIGFAVKHSATLVNNVSFMTIYVGDRIQAGFRYNTGTDQVQVYRGNTTLVASSPDLSSVLIPGVWQYLEFKVKIGDSNGFVEMRIDGETVWTSATNLDLKTNSSSHFWDNILFRGSGMTQTPIWDDLYICDAEGLVNNDFLGDIRVSTLGPSEDGDTISWGTSEEGVVPHHFLIDDYVLTGAPPETDYIETTGTGNIDLFEFDDITPTPLDNVPILGVQLNPVWRLPLGLPRQVRGVMRRNSTNVEASALMGDPTVQLGYLRGQELSNTPIIFETDEASLPWTGGAINDAQFGVKLET